MSELKFDPYTGKPIETQENKGYKFDPYTGKPIEQPESNISAPQFDPYTGKPISSAPASDNAQQGFNAQAGYNPGQSFNPQQNYNQQSYGAAQQQGNYQYNPGMYQPSKSESNKKVAFIVLGVVIVAFLALIVFGGIQVKKYIDKSKEAINTEQDKFAPKDSYKDVAEDPIVEPVPEPEAEPAPEETPEETPAEETPKEEEQEKEEPAPEEKTEPEAPEAQPEEKAVATNNTVVDENNIFAFRIGERAYQIPQKTSDFLADGWTFDNPKDADEMVGTGELFYSYLVYPDGEKPNIMVVITNFSLDAMAAKDAYVSYISFNTYDVEEMGQNLTTLNGKVILGQGNADDIKAAYGEPDYISESSLGDGYFYYDNSSSSFSKPEIMINFDEDNNYSSISFTNRDEPADFEQVEVSTDAPEYLSRYVAPTELGDDPFSGNFKLDGVVYNLPCPLQVLEDNGWQYDVEHDYSVGAGEGYVVQLHKGKLMLTLNVENFDTKATVLKNTMVTMISSNGTGLFENGIEYPGGLSATWSEKQLQDWIEQHNITNYENHTSTGAYDIPFNQPNNDKKKGVGKYEIFTEDGQISFMHYRCYGWLRD